MLDLKELNLRLLPPNYNWYCKECQRQREQLNLLITGCTDKTRHSISWSYDVFPVIYKELERAGWIRIAGKEINTFVPVWFVNSLESVDEYVSNGPIHSARDFYEKNLTAQREVINRTINRTINLDTPGILNYATPILKITFTLCPELISQMEQRGWVVKHDEVGVQLYPIWLEDSNVDPRKYEQDNGIISAYAFYVITLKRQAEEIADLISLDKRVNLGYEVYPALVEAMRREGWEYKPVTRYSQYVLPYSYFYPKWANGES